MKHARFYLFALLLIAFTVQRASAKQQKTLEPAHGSQAKAEYRGGLVTPPLPKPKFTLTDTSGALFDFQAKTDGYVALLFFGYTHCPDMCPGQMSMIARVFRQLPAGTADQFKVVFVTTDPERDSPQVLRSWLDNFDKRFIGLTGSEAAIAAAQVASNLPVAQKSAVRSDGAYEVGHAAYVLAYTKDNRAHVIYPVGVQPDDFLHDLPNLPKETWAAH
jgi:protein SCO1/2